MNADEYWARRSRERESEWFKKSQQTIEKELAAEYERSLQRLTQKVEALYGRFATENGLTMAEAVKLISGPEYKAWRMDIEDYVKQIGKTGDKGLLRELNTLSMRSRISRLDKLRGETLMELDKLGRKVDSSMTKFLSDAYTDTKRQTLGDLAKQGISSLATEVSPERVKNVLKTPWSGKNYSERIWKNTTKLADTIQTEIVNGVHRGSSVQLMTKRVQERMGVGRSDSERLVRTEMNYVNNTAALDSMREAKMKYFRFIATIDRRTSAICREHDGNLYELDEAAVGDNVPPLHARCRSTIAASLEGPVKASTTDNVKVDRKSNDVFPSISKETSDYKGQGVFSTGTAGDITANVPKSSHLELKQGIHANELPQEMPKNTGKVPPHGKGEPTTPYDVNREVVNAKQWFDAIKALGFSRQVTRLIRKEALKCLTKNDGINRERGIIMSTDGRIIGEESFGGIGGNNVRIHIPDPPKGHKKHADNSLIVIHNHPKNIPFSITDITAYLRNPSIHTAIVVCPNGSIYSIQNIRKDMSKKQVDVLEKDIQTLYTNLEKNHTTGRSLTLLLKDLELRGVLKYYEA